MPNENPIIEQLLQNSLELPNQPALYVKRDGEFGWLTWKKIVEDMRNLASELMSWGVRPGGDHVAQISENRYEWLLADFALQALGTVHVPLHATLTGAQLAQQLRHGKLRQVIVSNGLQAAKLFEHETKLPDGIQVLSYDPCKITIQGKKVQCVSEFLGQYPAMLSTGISADNVSTILYTSGTVGEPKGAMLSPRNLVSNAHAILAAFGANPDELRLNLLPLSHIFARTCDLYVWVFEQSRMALAESRETVLDDCRKLSPTMLNGVPYFFDKVYRGLCQHGLAERLGSLKAMLGGNVRMCVSGGAAASKPLVAAYRRHGVPLLQGYGLTEASPVVSACTLDADKSGSVGRPLPGVDVRVEDDGEILVRGENVMLGYYHDSAATTAAIHDGWLYTGDLGALDDEGFLYITGRKKEIIVTLSGKNIAPNNLESLLTQEPLIVQSMIVGDNRSYLVALIVPNLDLLRQEMIARGVEGDSTNEVVRQNTSGQILQYHPLVYDLYRTTIDHALRDLSHHEQVGRFALVARPFAVETGELTAKLTLRRDVVATMYKREIEGMYELPGNLPGS